MNELLIPNDVSLSPSLSTYQMSCFTLPTITRRIDSLLAVTIFGRFYWINDDLSSLILMRYWVYLSSIRDTRLSRVGSHMRSGANTCRSRRFLGRLVNLLAHKSPGHDGQVCLNRRIPPESRITSEAISRESEMSVKRESQGDSHFMSNWR